MWYSVEVIYVAGKNLVTADALSRAPQISFPKNDKEFADVVECHVDNVVQTLPVSNEMLE